MPGQKRKVVQLAPSDDTDDEDIPCTQLAKVARVKKEKTPEPEADAYDGPSVSDGEIAEAFPDDAAVDELEAAVASELEAADEEEEEQGRSEMGICYEDAERKAKEKKAKKLPEVIETSDDDDEDRPLVHPKKKWLMKIVAKIRGSKKLSMDRVHDAEASIKKFKRESDAQEVYNDLMQAAGTTWVSILDAVGPPPGGWQPLPADEPEAASKSDEEPPGPALCTHDRVQKILRSWRSLKSMKDHKKQREPVREVRDTDKALHLFKGRCAYEKLRSWVSSANYPHQQPEADEEAAKMLYLMLATKTKMYTNMATLTTYLKNARSEEAMALICLKVLNKSVDDERAVNRTAQFHAALAKVVANQ